MDVPILTTKENPMIEISLFIFVDLSFTFVFLIIGLTILKEMNFGSINSGLKTLSSVFFTLCFFQISGQITHERVASFSDSMFIQGVEKSLIPGGIVSVVTSDSFTFSKGYGYANYKNKTPVNASSTLFQLGSIGKAFTAISLIQQIEEDKIDLNGDVNKYLSDWKLNNTYKEAVTPFHLLTHTAGFNEKLIGYLSRSEHEVQPLNEHLSDKMPSTFQPAGLEINYSNYGYALAGLLTEEASKTSFAQYIENRILNPLGMNKSTYHLPDNYQDLSGYARGYQLRDSFNEVKSYPRHALPAGSIMSTADDMAIFMQALLRRDSLLLGQGSYDLLLTQQHSNHPRLTGYTCGLEVQKWGNIISVGKAGNVPGFLAVFLLFQDQDLGLFIAVNTETDNFFEEYFREFKKKFIPPKNNTVSLNNIVELDEYVGNYTNLRTTRNTIEEMFLLFMGHFEIYSSEEGNLQCYHNGGWQDYQYIDDDLFQNTESPNQYLAFKRNDKGRIHRLYRSEVVGGVEVPCSYRRLSWLERPRFLNDEYPFVLVFLITYLFIPIYWIFSILIKFRPSHSLAFPRIHKKYHLCALAFLAFFFWSVIEFFIPLLQNREEMLFGLSPGMMRMKYVHYAMAIIAGLMLIFSIELWRKKQGNILMRVYYSLYSLAALSYILILQRWHFLNISIDG